MIVKKSDDGDDNEFKVSLQQTMFSDVIDSFNEVEGAVIVHEGESDGEESQYGRQLINSQASPSKGE